MNNYWFVLALRLKVSVSIHSGHWHALVACLARLLVERREHCFAYRPNGLVDLAVTRGVDLAARHTFDCIYCKGLVDV